MAETAGSRMIPTFFAACICPWQYFGMKIRKRKRALGHQAGALFAGQIFLRLWSPGGRDWAHERKYPLPPIARRQCMGFLVIFGQVHTPPQEYSMTAEGGALVPREWCIHSGEMVHGGRRRGAPSRHAGAYSGRALRLRMDSPSIWIVYAL